MHTNSHNDINDISPAELQTMLQNQQEMILIDVREPHEWQAGHLPDAVHLPLGDIETWLTTLPHNKPIVVYCRSGGRSAHAMQRLQSAGFIDVKNLVGGILAWPNKINIT